MVLNLALLATASLAAPAMSQAASNEQIAANGSQTGDDIIVNGQRIKGAQAASKAQVGVHVDRDVFDTPFSTSGYTDQLTVLLSVTRDF